MDDEKKNQGKNQDRLWENESWVEEKEMKGFDKNCGRMENEVLIVQMGDDELVSGWNVGKVGIVWIFGMGYLGNGDEQDERLLDGIWIRLVFVIVKEGGERGQLMMICVLCLFWFLFVWRKIWWDCGCIDCFGMEMYGWMCVDRQIVLMD